jgi:hypothetical protein
MSLRKSICATIVCASIGLTATLQAQTAQDLVGSWKLVAIGSEQPGRDAASNSRASGTSEENRAVVQGSIALFGTYSVEDAGKTLVMRIENGTFPNWAGVEQRRAMTLSGDEFTYTTPGSGGVAAVVKLRRAT